MPGEMFWQSGLLASPAGGGHRIESKGLVDVKIRRLGWAGVEITAQDGPSLVVDYIQDTWLLPADENPAEFAAPAHTATAALVTHLHDDHTDTAAIQSAVGPHGLVLRPAPSIAHAGETPLVESAEADLAASSLNVRTVVEWERIALPPFTITAVPAVDGLGDPQVNWVIEADGQRIFHGGDTMFHGYWWLITRRTGPVDVAILPINGPIINDPQLDPPSPLPTVLTPEQAAQAAVLLRAKTVIPMHFGAHLPPTYVEQQDALDRLMDAAGKVGLDVIALAAGVSAQAVLPDRTSSSSPATPARPSPGVEV